MALTVRSSRRRFVPAKGGRNSLPPFASTTQRGLTQALGRMKDLLALLFVAALVAIGIYFQSTRDSQPSAAERRAALIWLVMRRIVCFGAAALCIAAAAVAVYGMSRSSISTIAIVGVVLALSFAFILFHWGMYGTGHRRYDVKDDKPVHELRKKRYGWPW